VSELVIGAAAATEALAVTAAALVTALATGLGALPLAARGRGARSWLLSANVLAAALMLLASALLFYQGAVENPRGMLAGAVAGLVAVALAGRWLRARETWHFEALRGTHARTALIIVAVMTVHSVAEGIGIGVSFGGGDAIGFATAAAIAVHNIPEGLAISLVLVPRGVSVPHAALWSVFSSVPQPLLALPAFLFVETFGAALPIGLGFAGGAMVWMVLAEIVPEAFSGRHEEMASH
jgi:zinc transporter, ZIP family